MRTLTLKQLKLLRFVLTIVFILTAFVAPILIVSDKMNIVSELTVKKISWIAVILIISIIYFFKKSILEYVNTLEYSLFKSFITGLSKVWLMVIILGSEISISLALKTSLNQSLQSLLSALDTFRYCIRWWCIFSITAYLGIRPLMDKCTYYIIKEDHKSELREVLKE